MAWVEQNGESFLINSEISVCRCKPAAHDFQNEVSGLFDHSGRSPLRTGLSKYGSSGPCVGMVWADTVNLVYSIEIKEVSTAQAFFLSHKEMT